jgi:DNA-binding NarL/FixJ family response regulator
LERWLAEESNLRIVGSYADARSALRDLQFNQPDLVILDFGLPDMEGGECLRRLKQCLSAPRVLVLTGIPDPGVVFDSLESGADGFLDKGDRELSPSVLIQEIRAVCEGRSPLSARARSMLIEEHRQRIFEKLHAHNRTEAWFKHWLDQDQRTGEHGSNENAPSSA